MAGINRLGEPRRAGAKRAGRRRARIACADGVLASGSPATRAGLSLLVVLALLLSIMMKSAMAKPDRIGVLLLSGQNNHAWEATTPALVDMLNATGRFAVAVTEHPETLSAGQLAGIDVIVSNWNAFPRRKQAPPVTEWTAEARAALVTFVRRGGGHVTVHAGGSSFYDWEDYHAITLLRWDNGKTSHGKPHLFPVVLDQPAHPVMQGLRGFEILDELWRRPGLHPAATVLASSRSLEADGGTGALEPCVVVGTFGSGRRLATSLGHDVAALENPALRELIVRSVQWAARVAGTPPGP